MKESYKKDCKQVADSLGGGEKIIFFDGVDAVEEFEKFYKEIKKEYINLCYAILAQYPYDAYNKLPILLENHDNIYEIEGYSKYKIHDLSTAKEVSSVHALIMQSVLERDFPIISMENYELLHDELSQKQWEIYPRFMVKIGSKEELAVLCSKLLPYVQGLKLDLAKFELSTITDILKKLNTCVTKEVLKKHKILI